LSIIGDYCPVEVDRCTFPGDFGFGLALVDTGAFTVDNCEAYNTHLDSDGLWGVGVVVYQSAPSSACVIGNSITGLRSHANAGPGLVVRGTQCALGITGGDYERNTSFGILAADTSYTHIIGANVVDTRADADGLFGDGIIVVNSGPGSTVNSTLSVITNSARAGITNFGGLLELGFNKLECNPIALDGETYLGSAPGFIDDGEDDNTCGCGGTTVTCQVLSSGLAAPTPPPTKL
jgi:hypothetical protein